MKRIFLAFLIATLLAPIASYAGIYGILNGKVVDEVEGKPVVGATIRIEGTTNGAKAKSDGTFTVTRITAGSYTVKVTAVGFAEYKTKVNITADNIAEIKVKMSVNVKQTKVIDVYGDATKKKVENTSVGIERGMDKAALTDIAREGIGNLVALNPGVFVNENGYYIRGSEPSETQIRVDGQDVGNQFVGSFGSAGMTNFPQVSQYATENVQVITGGASAEYGNLMGGVVNSTIKSGRTDRYEGFFRFRTDVQPLFGRQSAESHLTLTGNNYDVSNYGDGLKWQGSDESTFEFGIGGPLEIVENSTFYLTGSYKHNQYENNGYERIDPWGKNWGHYDNDQVWVKNILAKVKIPVTDRINVIVQGRYGLTNVENGGGTAWMYSDNASLNQYGYKAMAGQSGYNSLYDVSGYNPNGVSEKVAKLTVLNQFVNDMMIKLSHAINDESFYELTLSRTENSEESAKRKTFGNPGFFTGYDLWYPTDNLKLLGDYLVAGNDQSLDNYTELVSNDLLPTADKRLKMSMPLRNPVTGFYEGSGNASGTDNPWGRQGFNYIHGNSSGLGFRKSVYWDIAGNYNYMLKTNLFLHNIKAGFEARFYELYLHINNTPWNSDPDYNLYTDQWGGNIYASSQALKERTSSPFKPKTGSMYVQDQIQYKGIYFTPGLRLDFTDPNAKYRLNPADFVSYSSDTGFAQAKTKVQASPRVAVTYPISDVSNFRLSYGWFYKMPIFQVFYDGLGKDYVKQGDYIGNPNMEAEKTVEYEVAYQAELTTEYVFDVSAYYKDIYNRLGVAYVNTVPNPYYIYYTSDFGNAKGIEFNFEKKPMNHLAFRVNYTLSKATSSAFTSVLAIDPYTEERTKAANEYPLDNVDRRHRVNLDLTTFWGESEGPTIAGTHPLENMMINFSGFYQTGFAYSRQDAKGNTVGEPYSERQPDYWRIDTKIRRTFKLKDYFGESMGNTEVDLSFDITNLFNLTRAARVYARTGDADNPGYLNDISLTSFSETPWYKEGSVSRPETYSQSQYDSYGNRLYTEQADKFNQNKTANGIVTQDEKYNSYMNYLDFALKNRANYQTPREVYFSIAVRF